MVITPGPPWSAGQAKSGHLLADEGSLASIDPINNTKPHMSDAEGRIVLPALIPGASYHFIDRTTSREESGPRIRRSARSGLART